MTSARSPRRSQARKERDPHSYVMHGVRAPQSAGNGTASSTDTRKPRNQLNQRSISDPRLPMAADTEDAAQPMGTGA
jgi:hypothetical protein